MIAEDREHLVKTWIEHYHKWRSQDKMPEETLWASVKLDKIVDYDPELAWELILQILATVRSDKIYPVLAAGPLENLLVYHGEKYIERVEKQARQDPAFNMLLGGVWRNSIAKDVWRRVEKARKTVW